MENSLSIKLTRRSLLKAGAVSATAMAAPSVACAQQAAPGDMQPMAATVTLRVNGTARELSLDLSLIHI